MRLPLDFQPFLAPGISHNIIFIDRVQSQQHSAVITSYSPKYEYIH